MYTTPFMRLPFQNKEYLLDIWDDNRGKVFSVCWKHDINDLQIVSFKHGEWAKKLLLE